MKKIIFFALVAIATLSCTPKSARMTKAVIIDSKPRAVDAQTTYKVELPAYGISDFVVAYHKYEVGDTVLIHDKYRNYEIR
jgi:hypothetical protein